MTMKKGATDPEDLEIEDVQQSFISSQYYRRSFLFKSILSTKQDELEELARDFDYQD